MATIRYLTRIEFDFGAIRLLPDLLAELNVARPLLISDPGVAGAGFAWLRLRSGSVLAPTIVHAAVNSTALLAAAAST